MMKCFYESPTLLSGSLWTEYREKEPLMGKMPIFVSFSFVVSFSTFNSYSVTLAAV